MSRETGHRLKHERRRNTRAGLILVLVVAAMLIVLPLLLRWVA